MPQDALIEQAKRILRNEGYVVIPRDRRLVLTVSRAISQLMVDKMAPEQRKCMHEHCDRSAAHALSQGLQDSKAILKQDKGLHDYGYLTEYSIGVILPRTAEDNR